MIELLDCLAMRRRSGSGTTGEARWYGDLASHHPDRCHGVANLCVPYFPKGFSAETLLPLIDRTIYPEAEFPAGQWEYQLFYQENFDKARAAFEADVTATVKALFRKGNPAGKGKPSRTAFVRNDGGWFGGRPEAPDLPLDTDVLTEAELDTYVAALTRNGFFGPIPGT